MLPHPIITRIAIIIMIGLIATSRLHLLQRGKEWARDESRIRVAGVIISAAMAGVTFALLKMFAPDWARTHPRMVIPLFALLTYSLIGFLAFPSMSRLVLAVLGRRIQQ